MWIWSVGITDFVAPNVICHAPLYYCRGYFALDICKYCKISIRNTSSIWNPSPIQIKKKNFIDIFRTVDGQTSAYDRNVTVKLIGLESQREQVMGAMNRKSGKLIKGQQRVQTLHGAGSHTKEITKVSIDCMRDAFWNQVCPCFALLLLWWIWWPLVTFDLVTLWCHFVWPL